MPRVRISIRSKLGVISAFMLITGSLRGQNLVPNPSFETYDNCPVGLSGGPLECIPWINPTGGTSDYFNECSTGAADVPDNTFGFQDAHTGVAYGGGYYFMGNNFDDYREYLQTQFTEPLIAGTTYNVSLWYSLADDFGCPSNQLGIYISVVAPSNPGSTFPLDVTPQIQLTTGLITNTTTWLQLSGCYVATGGEEYITIGNFYTDGETQADPGCVNGGLTYLFIDDVEVIENGEPPGTIDFDLGPELEVCDSVVLDPGLGNVSYVWQDGSHEPTYTATQTGTYYLTVTSGCDFGVDSVDVTILGSAPPVDLGAEELTLCPGDEIELSLDPDFGTYTWQDGSTGSDYTITSPGTYSVTLDDGCGTTSDDVEVIGLNLPDPIALGNDTILCFGEELTLSFDPGLGDFEWQDMSTDPSYVITMAGTYSLTVSNMCGSVDDEIDVAYLPDPVIAFPDEIIIACPGDIVTLSFDPELGTYVWQDGTTGPEYEVTEEGVYSVTVMNMCATDFDEVFVDYLEEPQLDLGLDVLICPSQLPYIIDLSDIDHVDDYFWQDGSNEAVYEVDQGGVYAVTVSNECFSVSDEIEIVVEDAAPQVVLPADATLCPGETLILDVSNIPGDYTWQDGSTDPLLEVSQSGTYAVTVSNLCGIGADSTQIEYTAPVPPLNLGADIGLCPGDEISLQVNIPDVSYAWQDGSSGNTYLVTMPETVILTISNACEEVSDTLIATFDGTPPQLDLQDSIALCQGDSITLDAMIGGVSFDWNTGDTTQTLEISSSGIYSLTVSNTCGTASDTVFVLDSGSAPVVELGADLEICPGESVTIDANTNGSILWYDGTTGSSYVASSAGIISVQVTNSCGTAFDSLTISVLNATPDINLGPDTVLCPGEVLFLNPGIPNVSYLWSDGSTDASFIVDSSVTVGVQIMNACGVSQDSIVVDYHPEAPSFDLGPDASLCPGESILLSPGITGVNYLWQDGSMASTYTATQPGTIVVTLTSNCWQLSDTLEIFEDTAGPMIDLGSDTTVCEGGSVVINAGILGVNYLWHDGSTGNSFLATSTQEVILQVSNACGEDRDTIFVTIDGDAPEVSLGIDTFLCEGASFTLMPVISVPSALLWQDGSSQATFVVNGPGIYHLQAFNECGTGSDSIMVIELSAPMDFYLGADTVLCPGESLTLFAPATSDALQWSNGTNGSSLTVSSGLVWLSITNVCGAQQDSLLISVNSDILNADLDPLYQLCEGESVTLDVSQGFEAQYLWSTGVALASVTLNTSGSYSVTITSECDALQTSTEILIEDCSEPVIPVHLFIPNVFTPNGDHINDVFIPQVNFPERIGDYRLTIFNRWGDVVFLSTDLASGWNGTFNEKHLEPGVFVYLVQWRDLSNPADTDNERLDYGDITLIR